MRPWSIDFSRRPRQLRRPDLYCTACFMPVHRQARDHAQSPSASVGQPAPNIITCIPRSSTLNGNSLFQVPTGVSLQSRRCPSSISSPNPGTPKPSLIPPTTPPRRSRGAKNDVSRNPHVLFPSKQPNRPVTLSRFQRGGLPPPGRLTETTVSRAPAFWVHHACAQRSGGGDNDNERRSITLRILLYKKNQPSGTQRTGRS